MAELVNLRTARKRATRRKDEQDANASRLAHGQPKHIRKLQAAEQEKPVALSICTASNQETADEIAGCQTLDRHCRT